MWGLGNSWFGQQSFGAGDRGYGNALIPPMGYNPGFMPEWNYFPYSNPPASALSMREGNNRGIGDPNYLAGLARSHGFEFDTEFDRWNPPEHWMTDAFDPAVYEDWSNVLSSYMPDMSGYVTSQFDPSAYEGWGDLLSGYMPDMSG